MRKQWTAEEVLQLRKLARKNTLGLVLINLFLNSPLQSLWFLSAGSATMSSGASRHH